MAKQLSNKIKEVAQQSESGFALCKIKCSFIRIYDELYRHIYSFNIPENTLGETTRYPVISQGIDKIVRYKEVYTTPNVDNTISDEKTVRLTECYLSKAAYNILMNKILDKRFTGIYRKIAGVFWKLKDGKLIERPFHPVVVYIEAQAAEPEPCSESELDFKEDEEDVINLDHEYEMEDISKKDNITEKVGILALLAGLYFLIK